MAKIKFKQILKEAAWDHTSGKSLPTLEDVQKAYEAKKLNEGNSYYDLKVQYYEISDNMGNGGLLSTLQDIKKKAEPTESHISVDSEIKIWTAIHKLFNKSKLGKVL